MILIVLSARVPLESFQYTRKPSAEIAMRLVCFLGYCNGKCPSTETPLPAGGKRRTMAWNTDRLHAIVED